MKPACVLFELLLTRGFEFRGHERIVPTTGLLRSRRDVAAALVFVQRRADQVQTEFGVEPSQFVQLHPAVQRYRRSANDFPVIQSVVDTMQCCDQAIKTVFIDRPKMRVEAAISLGVTAVEIENSLGATADHI